MTAPGAVAGELRAWGWAAHLLDGGTTPWREWAAEGVPGGRILPGAQQLELLRRLNSTGRPSPGLARRVLDAGAPGRGRPDLPLDGAAAISRFGPRPVDPTDLPDDELVRVATGVLADDLVAAGVPPVPTPGWTRPWRTRYRLGGDPWLADPVRAELVARGRPPGGTGATVLVLGTDLPTMLAHAWSTRVLARGGPEWPVWLDGAMRRLPPRMDLSHVARSWSESPGSGRVELVLDPAALPRLLGVRRPLPRRREVAADAVELARRVAAVLGVLVPAPRRAELLTRGLRPRLAGAPGEPPGVPPEHAEQVWRRAVRMRDDLLRAGYPVHGDLDALLPNDARTGTRPSEAGVLSVAVWLLLATGPTDPEEAR